MRIASILFAVAVLAALFVAVPSPAHPVVLEKLHVAPTERVGCPCGPDCECSHCECAFKARGFVVQADCSGCCPGGCCDRRVWPAPVRPVQPGVVQPAVVVRWVLLPDGSYVLVTVPVGPVRPVQPIRPVPPCPGPGPCPHR